MHIKDHILKHLHESATHHSAVAELHKKISKTHETLAKHHDDHAEKAQGHRDLAQFHSTLSQHHNDREKHFSAMHSQIGNIADSELLPSHSDAGDMLREVADSDLLKRFCGIDA